jgi:rhodanese-related sulfurtransferase
MLSLFLEGCSAKAVAHVKKNGFTNAWNFAGGITAWSEQIDPTVPNYSDQTAGQRLL